MGRDGNALRRVRDEQLATSEAGREWVTLVERVELPVAAVLLADERLDVRAAAMIERAGRLVADEKLMVSDEDADQGLALLGDLAERAGAKDEQVRAGLKAVSTAVDRARRVSSGEVARDLMGRGPMPK
ncbi:hypothetical protein [Streptomyces flavofungini]|uniref:hypothetical protein n=1 Tax=Streptomyces flavofungini TaxID=68200 RepID=UPI0025B0B0E3|nr:hypothetical protein [Streptomyces flavofungini]WJV51644.1 hypothetical protein QUY26_38630 [Streptomyces flavofungini]